MLECFEGVVVYALIVLVIIVILETLANAFEVAVRPGIRQLIYLLGFLLVLVKALTCLAASGHWPRP